MKYLTGLILALALIAGGCSKSELASSDAAASSGEAKAAAAAPEDTSVSKAEDSSSPVSRMAGSKAVGMNPVGGMQPHAQATLATNASQSTAVTVQRSVIRSAGLTVRVKNVEQAEKAADGFVSKAGGYVEGAESNDLSSSEAQITMTARVPVGAFDGVLAQFESLGIRVKKTISGKDVTGQVLDYDARLKTMRAQEEVYRNQLRQSRSLDAEENLQQRLMELREQIESTTAQLKGLSELSALSTIELTLSQSMEAGASQPQDAGWAQESWAQAKGAGFGFYRGVVVVLMWAIVFCPLWLGGLLLLRWLLKVGALKPAPTSSPPPPPIQL